MNLEELEARVKRLEELIAGPVMGAPNQEVITSRLTITDEQGKTAAVVSATPDGATFIIGDPREGALVLGRKETGPYVLLTRPDGTTAGTFCMDEGMAQLILTGADHKAMAMFSASPSGPMLGLRDTQAKMRMAFSVVGDGTPCIMLYDEKGAMRLSLEAGRGVAQVNLHDPQGTCRAHLAVGADGMPLFKLTSSNDQRGIVLMPDKDGNGLRLFDSEGRPRLMVSVGDTGNPYIALANEQGVGRVYLCLDDENNGLRIYDSNKNGRLMVTVNADERPMISLCDANQKGRARLIMTSDGTPMFSLDNAEGRSLVVLSALAGAPGFILSDGAGTQRAILGMFPEGPCLVLTDENGDPMCEIPEPK